MKRISKLLVIFLLAVITVTSVLSFTSCGEKADPVGSLTAEQVLKIKQAYEPSKRLREKITVLEDLGTYNGNTVVLLKYDVSHLENGTPNEPVDMVLGGYYLGTAENSTYKITVYVDQKKCITLEKAFDGNYITVADIPAIMEKTQESQYLYEDTQ